jgi:AcrR family transcriptional regulator
VTTARTARDRPAEQTSAADEDKNNFRRRLLDAMALSIAEDGYQKTTVGDIVRRARTSRRTFYEHFTSKEECLVALLTDINAEQIRQIYAAVDREAPWQRQVRQAIESWISSAESRAPITLSWIRDVPSLGEATRRLQREVMENFVAMCQTITDSEEFRAAGVSGVSRQRIIMLLGGLRELTAITVENDGRMTDFTEEAVDAAIALLRRHD